jgi:hypothetical protein
MAQGTYDGATMALYIDGAYVACSVPETRNPKPETRNPKPETRNPKPETRNPEAEMLKPESANTG